MKLLLALILLTSVNPARAMAVSNKDLCDQYVEAKAQACYDSSLRRVVDHRFIQDVGDAENPEGLYEVDFGFPFKANVQFDSNCNVTHFWRGWF